MQTGLPRAALIVASRTGSDAIPRGVPGGCIDAAEKDVEARRDQPIAARGAGEIAHVYICDFPAGLPLSPR